LLAMLRALHALWLFFPDHKHKVPVEILSKWLTSGFFGRQTAGFRRIM
jgi:hypothetical protein